MGEKIKTIVIVILLVVVAFFVITFIKGCTGGLGNGSGSEDADTSTASDEESDSISESTQSQSIIASSTLSSSESRAIENDAENLVIVVHGQDIAIGTDTYSDAESLDQFISDHYSEGMSVILQDDYADYQIYQDVIETLDSLKIDYSEYIAD